MHSLSFGRTNQPSTANKHHGLLNQGATCYLNSVLQVLFMTEDFREAVEGHTCETCGTECIDQHLASLFDNLKGHMAYTYKITNKLGIDNVYEQRDAAQYFEKILGLTSPEASQIFHGLLTHKTICSACCAETEADGAFWHLPLPLLDSNREDYSVVDGIQEYFRNSDFSGENQMYCDECDAKSDAAIECVIKRHPAVLMLLLKRFEFDYRYMKYVKINRNVDVPYTLQLPENQTYELYAIVDHVGGLKSGHYTATIKSQVDEKWYKFNDDKVTLLDFQPFQVDDFEKSCSAYLLFYRKRGVHAADTCTKVIREMLTEEFLPATNDIHDQGEGEEVELGAAELGDNTVISIYRNEEIGSKDIVSGGGLPSDFNKEYQDNGVNSSQSIPYGRQKCNEERNALSYLQDAHAEKQSDKGKIMTDDEADVRRNAEKRETISRGNQLEESDNDHKDRGRLDDVSPDVSHDFKLEVTYRHAVQCHLNKQDESSDAQRRVMDGKTDKDGKTGEDEQSEKKKKPLTKCLGRDAEHQDNEGLDNIRQNIYDVVDKQEVGQNYGLPPFNVDKQGDGERMEIDDIVNKEGKIGADESGVAFHEFQDNKSVGDSKKNMSKDDQECEQGSSSWYKRHEPPKDSKRNVKYAEMRETSMTKQGVKDQDKRLDGVRQNRPEQEICVTHSTHKDVSVEKQAGEQSNNGDEPIQNRTDSSHQQQRLTRGRKVMENWGVGNVEKVRRGNSLPKARTGFNEDTVKEICGPVQSKTYQVKTIEEEIKEIHGNTKNIRIKTIEEGVCNLNLSESPLQKPQKRGSKRVIRNEENATNSTIHSNTKKRKQKFSKKSQWRQNRKLKYKQTKAIGCCPFSYKSWKKVGHTSESD